MEIRLNHILCHTIEEAKDAGGYEIADFLDEWSSFGDTVSGQTSGTTGIPQKVELQKKDMIASARLTNDFFGIKASSSMFLCLSPDYIAGKMMLVRAMIAGADLITVKPSSSPLVGIDIPLDFAAMVPMQVQESLSHDFTRERLKNIKSLIIGGAAVSSLLEQRLAKLPIRSYATYGMTETVSHVALRKLDGKTKEYAAIGDVWFSQDARGCLIINAPHLSHRVFETNDVVQLIDNYHFIWLGRYDNVINSGGVKLFPEKIEQKISPFISSRFFLTSQSDERLGERLVLVIEGKRWDHEKVELFKKKIAHVLTPYECPKLILFKKHFQETYSGKIIRRIVE